MHEALLGRVEAQDHILAVAPDDLGIGTGRTRNLATLANLELDIVYDGTNRNIAGWHRIAGLHIHVLARNHGIARREPLRREDIAKLPVLVLEQSDEGGAVRVIFDALDLGRYIEFPALEVDVAIR